MSSCTSFPFLPPRDVIVAARQVCHNFNHISMNISLWKTLLRRICVENTLLSSSFADIMNLKDFEHAATAPSRYITELRSSSERGVPLNVYARNYIDVDELMNQEAPNFSETVTQLYLIPGGRFLITQHVSGFGNTDEIHLWDLGIPGDTEGIPAGRLPIASLNDRSFLATQPAHPTRDGKGILVFCCKDDVRDDRSQRRREIFIYEIYPALEAPSFCQIATHEMIFEGRAESAVSFNHSKVAMLIDSINIYVWDFITKTQATWSAVKDHDRILLQDNFVILYCGNSVFVYRIPVLHPGESALATNIHSLDPFFHSDIDCNQLPNIQSSVEGLGAWYSGLVQPIYIDSLSRTEGRHLSTTCHRVDISSVTVGNITEPSSSISPSITIDFNLAHDITYFECEYRVCDDNVILYWNSVRGITIQYPQLNVSHNSDDSGTSQPLLAMPRSPRVRQHMASMCPASGRVACCEPDRYLIEIIDFLRHPSATGVPLAYEPSELDSGSGSEELDS